VNDDQEIKQHAPIASLWLLKKDPQNTSHEGLSSNCASSGFAYIPLDPFPAKLEVFADGSVGNLEDLNSQHMYGWVSEGIGKAPVDDVLRPVNGRVELHDVLNAGVLTGRRW